MFFPFLQENYKYGDSAKTALAVVLSVNHVPLCGSQVTVQDLGQSHGPGRLQAFARFVVVEGHLDWYAISVTYCDVIMNIYF